MDTENLILKAKGAGRYDQLHVCGFILTGSIQDPANTDVDKVEVTDGGSSSGGLNTDDEPTAILYAKVTSLLRKKGFNVVPCLKDYF